MGRRRGKRKDYSDQTRAQEVDGGMLISSYMKDICNEKCGGERSLKAMRAYLSDALNVSESVLTESATMADFALCQASLKFNDMLRIARHTLDTAGENVAREQLNSVFVSMIKVKVTGGPHVLQYGPVPKRRRVTFNLNNSCGSSSGGHKGREDNEGRQTKSSSNERYICRVIDPSASLRKY